MQTPHGPPELPAASRRVEAADLDSFSHVVRVSRERARELVGRLGAAALADTQDPLHSITDEWLAAVEQLQVAEDELRQQNEQLAESAAEVAAQRARYQELFELAPDAYLVTDAYGAVRESNRAAAALFRIPRGHLNGKPLAVFIDPDARRVFRECVNELARAPRVEQLEMRLRPRYGPPVYVSLAATASRDANGNVVNVRWILRDVTDQRRAAERVRAVTVTVERRVAERTAGLEQAILERDARIAVLESELAAEREARLRADALGARRSDLVGVLSHEIRTPLHATQGYLELLEMSAGTLTPEQQGYLARMQRVQDYLVKLLEGMLALSRLERGVAELSLGEVSLARTFAMIAPLVQPQVLEKGIRYEQGPSDPSVSVYADAEKLQQIMLNLVTNAVKFTPAGGVVSVSWEAGADAVSICVRDTGRGVRPADLERIFEPFVQGSDGAAPGARRGVGLGLAISRQLARLMGGDLTVASALGEGSTFTATLPRYAHSTGGDRGDA